MQPGCCCRLLQRPSTNTTPQRDTAVAGRSPCQDQPGDHSARASVHLAATSGLSLVSFRHWAHSGPLDTGQHCNTTIITEKNPFPGVLWHTECPHFSSLYKLVFASNRKCLGLISISISPSDEISVGGVLTTTPVYGSFHNLLCLHRWLSR